MSVSIKEMKTILDQLENSKCAEGNFYLKEVKIWEDDLETIKDILKDLINRGPYEFELP